MRIAPFTLERVQSEWEHRVRYNLSESGVSPLSARALLGDGPGLDALVDAPLVYTQTNGTPELRALIAALYPGAAADHVQVTNAPPEVLPLATPLLQLMAPAVLLDAWNSTAGSVLRSHLHARPTMVVNITMQVVHLALAVPLMGGAVGWDG